MDFLPLGILGGCAALATIGAAVAKRHDDEKARKAAEAKALAEAEKQHRATMEAIHKDEAARVQRWVCYFDEIARLTREACDNPPADVYRVEWLEEPRRYRVLKWFAVTDEQLPIFVRKAHYDYREPPEPEALVRWVPATKDTFPTIGAARVWIEEDARTDKATKGFDAQAKPVALTTGA